MTLARRLRTAGAEREQPVAVYLDRSPAAFVVLLAVLRAGGAYVAIDTGQPVERLALMLDDLRPALLVTEARLRGRLGAAAGAVPVLAWDEPAAAVDDVELPPGDPESAAYMIYTSGSTGRPKAVVIPHAALTHHCHAIAEAYDIREGDRGVLMAALTFDLAMEQMAVPLVVGAGVAVCEDRFWPPDELPDRFAEHGVTNVLLPPAYYREMMTGVRPGDPRLVSMRTMGVGADVVTHDDARRWLATGLGGRFVNGYGPTEATIACVTHTVTADEVAGAAAETAVPIGRPVTGSRAYVLDANLEPVPVGVAGELCIGGPRVSRGYLRQPRLTADRFVPDPYGRPGDRLYRTGDQARLRPGGVIEFLGRIDTQVKIRGFRIELGEIEAALAGHSAVRAAAVAVQHVASGDRRLVGYVVPESGAATASARLREHLRERLPEYMVPAVVVTLDALPMTASGKVDRRALPPPADTVDPTGPDRATEGPRTEVEEAIAAVWADVLGRPAVAVDDDFFDIGGHSLLATRVLVRLRDLFGLDIPLRVLFEATSVATLAAALERLVESQAAEDQAAVPATRE
jgi:amino acid adenylation domain-containing protein